MSRLHLFKNVLKMTLKFDFWIELGHLKTYFAKIWTEGVEYISSKMWTKHVEYIFSKTAKKQIISC